MTQAEALFQRPRSVGVVFRVVALAALFIAAPALAKSVAKIKATKSALLTIADDPNLSRHQDLERMFADDQIVRGLKVANARLKKHPQDPELYVHAFRFRFARGEQLGRSKKKWDKEAYYEDMVKLSEQGLEMAPGHPRLLWGLGIAKGRLATSRGILASLTTAKEIEDAWLAVIAADYHYQSRNGVEMLPCDTMVALGMFYRLVPDWWIVGLIAGTRGDIDQSINFLHRADRCRPEGIGTLKELGVSYLCKADREDDNKALAKGRAALKRSLSFKAQWSIQRLDQAHARLLLKRPKLACGYSRDGQQEFDESELGGIDPSATMQAPTK